MERILSVFLARLAALHTRLTLMAGTHGAVDVAEYSWGHDVRGLMAYRSNHDESKPGIAVSTDNDKGFNVVVCADCLYATSSVEPLLFSLRQVNDGGA